MWTAPRSGLDREQAAADASQTSVVGDLLHRLDPDRRAALVLTQDLGLSYEEAAAVCGCATGTIRSRVARGPCRTHRRCSAMRRRADTWEGRRGRSTA